MQARTMDITQQLVADRRSALVATARQGRLHRFFSRVNRQDTVTVDIAALERADAPAPAVIARTSPVAAPEIGRVHKVA